MSEVVDAAYRSFEAARGRYRETLSREDDLAMLEAWHAWDELRAGLEVVTKC